MEKGRPTVYPVPYKLWELKANATSSEFSSPSEFKRAARAVNLLAKPVPGTDAGPWLKGTAADFRLWAKMFGAGNQVYLARKGITTDRNGIFFVEVDSCSADGTLCKVSNDPAVGRTYGIPKVLGEVESEHLFPILRGRGVRAFSASPDPQYRILLPQRAMHGNPELPIEAPGAYRFLRRFKKELETRSSYRRFQKGQPYWSVWSTGPYTFSRFKVVWREMVGARFVAAYVGEYRDPILGRRIVVPDHKLYFVPVATEQEAAYLTAILNSPTVSHAVSAYAAQLSLGVSVVEYLKIPMFDGEDQTHTRLAKLSVTITSRGGEIARDELEELDSLTLSLFVGQVALKR